MNLQEIMVYVIVASAIMYMCRRIYKSIAEKQCNKGCGGACSSVDFSKIKVKE